MKRTIAVASFAGTALAVAGLALLSVPAFAGAVSQGTPVVGAAVTPWGAVVTGALPPGLRAAFYRSLAKEAGSSYDLNAKGCATLPDSKLGACFNDGGAQFKGVGTPLALRLTAWGRGDTLTAVNPVEPVIKKNRVSYAYGNVAEWWRVLPIGFEQGFMIEKRPTGHGDLTLALAASVKADRQGSALAWGTLHYGQLVVTDAKGKVIPAKLKNAGDRILVAVNDAHAVYPITVDPLVWVEQKVTASDGAERDNFGWASAVSGTTAVIGSVGATIKGNVSQGAAYVFTDENGVWTQTAKLVASDGASFDNFGASVAVSGTTALIGAPEATVKGTSLQGAAYVFTESDGVWTQTEKLTASDGAEYDVFGDAVALSGTTALIGSDQFLSEGTGVAYVFSESNGDWTQTAKLTANDGEAGDSFGIAVALDGTTALVGADQALSGGPGAAYVFNESNGSWNQAQKLTASGGEPGDSFGYRVALDGATAVVGAPSTSVHNTPAVGAAYVYGESSGVWTQTQQLASSNGAENDYFGGAVALSGTTIFVGAPFKSNDQGALYIFSESNGTWGSERELTETNPSGPTDEFGFSVALSDPTGLVGASLAYVNGNAGQGTAYFYGQSNLGLALSAPQTVGQGQQYTSQTIATNSSSVASPAVSATITVPAAASFVSATASQGSCNEASGVVTCDFGPIAGNAGMATASVTLKATGSAGTTIENTASVARATPALTASAPTGITSPAACPAGYTEFSGHLDAGETFTSEPITVNEAGQKYVGLTSPASFGFFAIVTSSYGTHTYIYPHAKQGHRWGAAGSYRVGVQAGPGAGGDYTLCVNLNPAQ